MNTVSLGDITLSYREAGAGSPILFVHGFPLDHSMWNGQIDVLSKRFRAIAPDLRGFGRSGVTDGVVTMERMADDLAALLDALAIGEPIVLCGLSMGGYIALEFWRKYAARLRGLVFCDTRAAADKPEIAANRLTTAERVLTEGVRPVADSMKLRVFSPRTAETHPHLVEATERVMHRTDPRGVATASRGMARRRDFTAELKDIECPALVLVGADDALSPPSEMEAMAAGIPDALFRIIPDAGHLAPLEQPTATNAALEEFLDSLG
jgi:pimeloyl-ACP methyl ester carboxylesterase